MTRRSRWAAAAVLGAMAYGAAWVNEPVPSGADTNNVVEQVGLLVLFAGLPLVAGAAVLGTWRRPWRWAGWVLTMVGVSYAWLVGLFTSFSTMELDCTGDACATSAPSRLIGVATFVALVAASGAAESRVARRRRAATT